MTTNCTLKIPEEFRRYCGGKLQVTLAGDTLGDALKDLVRLYPMMQIRVFDSQARLLPHLSIIRGGQLLRGEDLLNTRIGEGEILELFPAASGG